MSDITSEFRSPWFRFRLKTLFVVMALVAVYLGGRASMRPHPLAPQAGTWQMNTLSGHQGVVTLTTLPDGTFLLNTPGVFSGRYRWNAGRLEIEAPNDKRFLGLAWQWDGDQLVLVDEPPNRPAGPSYLGTRLRFISPDISTTAQQSVPVVPPRRAVEQPPPRGGHQPQVPQPAFRPTPWRDPVPGEWQLTLPAAFKRSVQLNKRPDGTFELATRIVLGGRYAVRNEQLEVVTPDDPRMMGLAWAWQDDELVLVSEPSPPPTGSSYLGARLSRVAEEANSSANPSDRD